jgi:hypothetical protein
VIKTSRANNGTPANYASVAAQPQNLESLAAAVQQQQSQASHPSAGFIPVREVVLPLTVIYHAPETVTTNHSPSLVEIVESMGDPGFIFSLSSGLNNIMPTFGLTLDGGRTYDPRVTQGFVTTTTKFQPYEQLTGIAQERPEIVMLTNFEPLYDKDASSTAPAFQNVMEAAGLNQFMTDAGQYIDAQFNLRNLQSSNVNKSIGTLATRYPGINQTVTSRASATVQALNQLKADASFLLNLVRIIETQKSQLDLRSDLFIVDPQDTADFLVSNFSQLHLSVTPNAAPGILAQLVQVGPRPTYDCVDTLVDLGYTADNVTNIFASTKIWMQLLVELRGIVQHHSLAFLDIAPTYQKNDNNASTILTPPSRYFSLSANLPTLPTLDELIGVQAAQANTTIAALMPAWTAIYSNVFFKSEEARIAALAHLVSQEFRYSYGLSRPQVVGSLGRFYGFVVAPTGNSTVFDAIIGKFGNNITDFPLVSDSSLASIAQEQVSVAGTQEGILTFETKYVEGDTGTLTPGGDYFFDQILQTDGLTFNTANLDQLTSTLDAQLNQLSIMIDGFNMMALPSQPNSSAAGTAVDTEDYFLNNPSDVVTKLVNQLINPTTGQAMPTVANDGLGAIYGLARTDPRIKTILFMYTLSKVSRTYANNVPFLAAPPTSDNTPLVDQLIAQLISELEATAPPVREILQRRGQVNQNSGALTNSSISAAMKAGTRLTQIVEQFMSDVISQFRQQTTAINQNYTRYGGYLDTVVMMAAFDFVISTVARYSNQQLTGQYTGQGVVAGGQVTYAVSQTTTDHVTSLNELTQRLAAEANLSREVIMTVLNVLRKLSGSLKGISNYLNGPQAQEMLTSIAQTVNNTQLLNMLFNEQQIMMLASTVESLIVANTSTSVQPSQQSVQANSAVASNQINILDESDVPLAMKDALNSYFSQGDLASREANNKCILTVGIPSGFTQKLKQKVSVQAQQKSTFQTKQSDIVQLTVYKVDLTNPDIVYQPVRYMFEMSRFPTRYGTSQWLPIPDQASLADIVNAIPTQCYSQNLDSSTSVSISSGIDYASTAIADSEGIKGAQAAFDDPSYAFLTAIQKAEILNNHVASQLLESYIKLMTGICVAEYNYDMAPPPAPVEAAFTQLLTDHMVSHLSEASAAQNSSSTAPPAGGILFSTTTGKTLPRIKATFGNRAQTQPVLANPSGIAGQVTPAAQFRAPLTINPASITVEQQAAPPAQVSLNALSARNVPLILTNLQTLSTFSHTWSSLSNVDALNQKVMSPKQFDRVFNVMVDPRDFQIDIVTTNSTPWGRQALNLLVASGDVVPTTTDASSIRLKSSAAFRIQGTSTTLQGRAFPQNNAAPNVNGYVFRDRDKNQGDLIAEKYYVTIETFGEGQV